MNRDPISRWQHLRCITANMLQKVSVYSPRLKLPLPPGESWGEGKVAADLDRGGERILQKRVPAHSDQRIVGTLTPIMVGWILIGAMLYLLSLPGLAASGLGSPGLAVSKSTSSGPAQTRQPSVPPDTMVPVELATVGLEGHSRTPVVLLREPDSGDFVLISIGQNEALAILMALRDVATARPMTHDLLAGVITALDAEVERVMVDALVGSTFTGIVQLRLGGQEQPVYVDARPSDSLALAVRTDAPILVAPDVLVAAQEREFFALPGDQVVTALGITVGTLTEDLREALDLPADLQGVVVRRTIGMAAARGLAEGALVYEINGVVPQTPMDFLEEVQRTPSGSPARLRYWQAGASHELELSTQVPQGRSGGRRASLPQNRQPAVTAPVGAGAEVSQCVFAPRPA